jgi:glycosyltransferase involved in cell wall biosynthesis
MKKKIICYFSPVSFDFIYQRPQVFAEGFSKHLTTLYFEGPTKKRKLNIFFPTIDKKNYPVKDNDLNIIQVPAYFSFLGIPFRFPKPKMKFFIRKWLKFYLAHLEKKYDLYAFIQTPIFWDIIKEFPFKKVFYDCIDESSVLKPKNIPEDVFQQLFLDAIRNSNKVFVTADVLEEGLKTHVSSEKLVRVPNGVLFDKFQNVLPHPEILKIRENYEHIIGYVGALYHWNDFELLEFCAEKNPKKAFVYVGPHNKKLIKKLEEFKNVFFLGQRPFNEVPAFMNSFDVSLNPFKVNDIGQSTNPIKLFEYLSTGCPVVSTPIHELKYFEGNIYKSESKKHFSDLLTTAINEDSEELREKRRQYAFKNSWDKRIETMLSAMDI